MIGSIYSLENITTAYLMSIYFSIISITGESVRSTFNLSEKRLLKISPASVAIVPSGVWVIINGLTTGPAESYG